MIIQKLKLGIRAIESACTLREITCMYQSYMILERAISIEH